MSFITFGDLASSFQARQMNARLRQDMTRLGLELTTGLKQDTASAVTGDYGPIAGLEHSLKLLESHQLASNEANLMLVNAQISLEKVQNHAEDLSKGLISTIASNNTTMINATAVDAREKFAAAISALNTDSGGRAVFAGAATDGPALADADIIMAELMTAISGETTAAGVSAQIDAWFNAPGGGFETLGYIGADEIAGPVRLRPGEELTLPFKGDNENLRDTLSAFAKGAVMAEGALSGNVSEQVALVAQASTDMLGAVDKLTMLRAHVGSLEARVESALAQNAAEKSTLELSRNSLIAVDPYETATALEALYGQMEALYTVTARLSKLNFTDYMR